MYFYAAYRLEKREEFSKIQIKDWGFLIGSGFFLALHFLLWFESLKHTTVASSTIILALQPIVSLVGGFSYLKKEQHTQPLRQWELRY